MEDDNGFFVDDTVDVKVKEVVNDMPLNVNVKCKYCGSFIIDQEILNTFSLQVCKQCRYKNIKFITKTHAIKELLLDNYDLKNLSFISRPNPHKGNWHDMILYLETDVKKASMHKYGSFDVIENIKQKKIEVIKSRKIKKLKSKIRDLKRRTVIKSEPKKTHIHKFEDIGTNKQRCSCGLKIEREEI